MRSVPWILGLAVAVLLAFLLRNAATSLAAPSPIERSAAPTVPDREAETTTNPTPRERVPEPARDVGAHAVHVRVVATLPTGEPAVAAVVRYRDVPADPSTRNARKDEVQDIEMQLAAAGREAVTDDRGFVAIAASASSKLSVRCGEHYGEAFVDGEHPELRIALERDVSLRVQLVDTDGRPREHFRIGALVRSESRREGDGEDKLRLPLTDANGNAVLPHVQLAMTMPGPDIVEWRMVLRCDLDPVVERVVTATELLAGQPLRLHVPTGGAIVATIVAADGRGMWAGASLEDPVSGETRGDDREDGASWFRQLPLGRRWVLVVRSFDHVVRRDVAGPTHADEVVRTRIELPLRCITLHGRVVRPDGVPIPQADIRFTGPPARFYRDTERSRDGSVGDTIGDFDFGGVLPADVEAVTGATLHIERRPYCAPTTIALSQMRPGTNDLGDVVVSVAPDEILLASVEVRVAGRNVTADAWAGLAGVGDVGITSVTSFAVEHGDRITFRGPPTSIPLEVDAHFDGCLPRRAPVRLGEHVVVELEPAAMLTLHLLLPRVPRSLWKAELIDADGHQGSYYRTDDGFEWRTLVPGRYTLHVVVDGQSVHEASALDLRSGANAWPRDGTALDLRRSAQAFHVDIGATDGSEVEWPHCFVLPVDRAAPPDELDPHQVQSSPPKWFVARPQPVELVVAAAGFVPVRIPAPSADTVVRLARCTTLRVHTAQGDGVNTIVRVVEDGVRDPWLRALDTENLHGTDTTAAQEDPVELTCAPGTVVELVVERSGVKGSPLRVAIGREPIEITAR